MKAYESLLVRILNEGEDVMDRTGVGTRSLIGGVFQHDLRNGFPALTTKKLAWKAVVGELLWFMRGMDNVYDLAEITHGDRTKRTIWHDNYENQGIAKGYEGGRLGPVYGVQWRSFVGRNWADVDQLKQVIEQIKTDPTSRRLIVSAWNPTEIDNMTLPPCHVLFRFHVRGDTLGLTWYQRSADAFLGVPFNIASYALLLSIVADMTGYKAGLLTGMFDDLHIYNNHFYQVCEQIGRTHRDLPTLKMHKPIRSLDELDTLKVEDFELVGYNPHPAIKAPMAV